MMLDFFVKHTRGVLLAAASLILLPLMYCAGSSHGRSAALTSVADSVAKVLADSAKAQHARTARDSTARAAAERRAAAADASRDSALVAFRSRVHVVSPPGQPIQVSIDGGPPVREIPADLAIPPIQLCGDANTPDAALVSGLRAEVADLRQELATAHEQTAAAEAKARAGHARFGFKTGLITGGGVVLLIAALLGG